MAGGTTSVCWAGHEYGDALYRSMSGSFAGWGHTGMAAGLTSNGTPKAIMLQQEGDVGWGDATIVFANETNLTNPGSGMQYWGARQRSSSPTFAQRRALIDVAILFNETYTDLGYTWLNALMASSTGSDDIDPWQVDQIRCDGLIEYCYEYTGLDVWGQNGSQFDISRNNAYMESHNNFYDAWFGWDGCEELAPVVQCGYGDVDDPYAGDCTYLSNWAQAWAPVFSSVDQDPPANGQVNVEFTAKDIKSGIHAIYVKSPSGQTTVGRNIQHPNDVEWSRSYLATQTGYYEYWAVDNANNAGSHYTMYIDVSCSTSTPGAPSANPSSGCDPLTVTVSGSGGTQYDWQYRPPSSSSWYNFGGSSSSATKTCNSEGTWRFRYKRRNGDCDWSDWGSSRSVSVQDCSDPEGACCIGSTCYSNWTQDDCDGYSGSSWLGAGSSCSGDPCGTADPVGACCMGTSCYSNWTADECDEYTGSSWLGAGSSCSGDPCSDGGGGCPAGEIEDCNGNCAPAGWVGDGLCDDGAYTWNGIPIYLNCAEFNCDGGDCTCDDDPVGACCVGDSCSTGTAADCNAAGGDYQGDGSTCDGDPCGGGGGGDGDTCSDAVMAYEGANAFSTLDSSDSGFGEPDESQCSGTWLDWSDSADAWFIWTAAQDGLLSLSTCDADSYDTSLVLYRGVNCNSIQQIACNGDMSGGQDCQPYFSQISDVQVTQGETFMIRIGGWLGDVGQGTLHLSFESGASDSGGCCLGVSCAEMSETDCQAAGGLYRGDDSSCDQPCADATGDGLVNVSDLIAVLSQWGACANACSADLTGDGVVDNADLLLVIAGFGS
jgi:hypothetical protein